MQNIKWKRLIRAIKNEGAVLFVGPDVEKNEDGKPIFPNFCKKMLDDYEGEVTQDKDGLFFFIDPEAETDVVYDMKEFYEKHDFGTDVYKQIAAIPFHLIITLSPDDAIHNVFKTNGVKHRFAYFDSLLATINEISVLYEKQNYTQAMVLCSKALQKNKGNETLLRKKQEIKSKIEKRIDELQELANLAKNANMMQSYNKHTNEIARLKKFLNY